VILPDADHVAQQPEGHPRVDGARAIRCPPSPMFSSAACSTRPPPSTSARPCSATTIPTPPTWSTTAPISCCSTGTRPAPCTRTSNASSGVSAAAAVRDARAASSWPAIIPRNASGEPKNEKMPRPPSAYPTTGAAALRSMGRAGELWGRGRRGGQGTRVEVPAWACVPVSSAQRLAGQRQAWPVRCSGWLDRTLPMPSVLFEPSEKLVT